MKNRSRLFSSLFTLFVALNLLQPAAVYCNTTSLKDLIHDIKDKSAALRGLTCDFTQTRTLALFNKPIVFHGNLALIRPDRLRWEFTSPVPSVLILNGDSGMRCNDKMEPIRFDLAKDPIMRMVAEQLWTWLNGDYSKLGNDYTINISGESAIIVTPVNKETSTIIKDISIVFNKKNRQPESVTIREPGGDETSIAFSAYRLSPSIPDSTFTICFPRD